MIYEETISYLMVKGNIALTFYSQSHSFPRSNILLSYPILGYLKLSRDIDILLISSFMVVNDKLINGL
jgi:hypothetical protein